MKETNATSSCRKVNIVLLTILMFLNCAVSYAQNPFSDLLGLPAQIDFARSPQTMGKIMAGSTHHTYYLLLGSANFSPELVYPLYTVFNSDHAVHGLPGAHWRIPQLESSLHGNIWLTPWGETVAFPDITRRFRLQGKQIHGLNSLRGWCFTFAEGHLQRIESPYHRFLDFSYNETGQPVAVKQGEQTFITVEYEAGKPVHLSVNGIRLTLGYDRQGRFSSCQNGVLVPHLFTYNDAGQLVRIAQGDHVDTLTLKEGKLVEDSYYQYHWHDNGELELVNKNGIAKQYCYRDFRLEEKKKGTVQRYVQFQPSADQAFPGYPLVNSEVAGHRKTEYQYDAENRLVMYRKENGNRLHIVRNENGLVTALLEQASEKTAKLPRIAIEYDQQHRPVSYTRLKNDGSPYGITLLTYDKHGQVTLLRKNDVNLVMTYTPSGHLSCLASSTGGTNLRKYNAWNQLILQSNGTRHQKITYNQCGLIDTLREVAEKKLLHEYSFSYDVYGHLVELKDAIFDNSQKWTYSADGLCLSSTNGNGHQTKYEYGKDRRLETVKDPLGHPIHFVWGEYGLISRTTAIGQQQQISYNDLGLVESEVAIQTGSNRPARAIRIAYDDMCRPVSSFTSDGFGQITTYDEWGRCASCESINPQTGENRRTTYSYDDFGRETLRQDTTVSHGKVTDCRVTQTDYDISDRRTKLTIRKGTSPETLGEPVELTWAYDSQGRLTGMTGNGHTVSYRYGYNGQLAQRTIDGIETRFSFNALGQLEKAVTGTENAIFYTYDGDRLAGMTVRGTEKQFRYDKAGQLLDVRSAVDGKLLEEYSYDAVGNILAQTVGTQRLHFKYDNANQLTHVTGENQNRSAPPRTLDYDAAGRLVRLGDKQYQYGWYNSPVHVESDSETHDYAYYPDGQLAQADDVSYVWDGLALLQRGTDICLNESGPQGGSPLVIGNTSLMTDQLGTTVAAITGDTRQQFDRSAFGQIVGQDAKATDGMADFFTGKPMVPGLGHAFLLRQYMVNYGRWSSVDPLGYPDGWNPFVYCGNMPTFSVDPNGGMPLLVAAPLIGAGIGMAVQIGVNVASNKPWYTDLGKAGLTGAISGLAGALVATEVVVGVTAEILVGIVAPAVINSFIQIIGTEDYSLEGYMKTLLISLFGGAIGNLYGFTVLDILSMSSKKLSGQVVSMAISSIVDGIISLIRNLIEEINSNHTLEELYSDLEAQIDRIIQDIDDELDRLEPSPSPYNPDAPKFKPMRLIFE